MRDMKLRDMKMRHQNARVENARHENARNTKVWTSKVVDNRHQGLPRYSENKEAKLYNIRDCR